jgi:hypothetical protein
MFVDVIQTMIDLAREKTQTVEGKCLLARFRIARNGTRTCPETIAVAGYFGLVTGVTENGEFLSEETLEDLGEQLQQLARMCPGEVLVFADEPSYDEKTEQFDV